MSHFCKLYNTMYTKKATSTVFIPDNSVLKQLIGNLSVQGQLKVFTIPPLRLCDCFSFGLARLTGEDEQSLWKVRSK